MSSLSDDKLFLYVGELSSLRHQLLQVFQRCPEPRPFDWHPNALHVLSSIDDMIDSVAMFPFGMKYFDK